jgi:hypothetical protein
LAKKCSSFVARSPDHPSAAKAAIILQQLGGTDKSEPFQDAPNREFFSKL